MRVAGIGFSSRATAAELARALAEAEADGAVDLVATAEVRAAALAAALPSRRVRGVAVAGVATPTESPRVRALFGTGSVAEAAAMVAAGRGARLTAPRRIAGRVSIALAEGEGQD